MERLRKRAEFAAVARGRRIEKPGFVLQAARRENRAETGGSAALPGKAARFGFTVTKRLGNAPTRNRIRRRLREAVRIAAPAHAAPGMDYVVVGRAAALRQPFDRLVADLIDGLDRVSVESRAGGRRSGRAEPERANDQ
jgi:ribonuclease P protein component